MNHPDLDSILRHPPRPTPPSDLRDRLRAGTPGFARNTAGFEVPRPAGQGAWLKRWWPALGPAAAALACAAVFTAQQGEIRALKAPIHAAPAAATTPEPELVDTPAATGTTPDPSLQEAEEIARLRSLAATLRDEVARLQSMQNENTRLRSQLSARTAASLTPEEAALLEAAREKAESIQCVNNLKQFGLAVRVWAIDNGDVTPPNLVCLSNELSTPKILVCPTDKARKPASDFTSFTPANCSYEYLAPSAPDGEEPTRVLSRCAMHGHIGLCDGSVQMGVAKAHPERLVSRDGKLFLEQARVEHVPVHPGPAN